MTKKGDKPMTEQEKMREIQHALDELRTKAYAPVVEKPPKKRRPE